jgi:hypothetical protein
VQMNLSDDHRRALALLARRPDCRTEVELLRHGFTRVLLADLVQSGHRPDGRGWNVADGTVSPWAQTGSSIAGGADVKLVGALVRSSRRMALAQSSVSSDDHESQS